MGEWEEKLGAILNNPQAMSQIMSIAQSLGGSGSEAPGQAVTTETAPEEVSGPVQDQVWTPVSADPTAPGPELDPRVMAAGMRALSVWQNPDDPRAALLQALRPFMREERQGKLDRAIRVARLSKTIRAALDGLQQGGVGRDV